MRVYFLISNQPYFDEILPVVLHYLLRGHDATILLDYKGPKADAAMSKCAELGVPVIFTPDEVNFGVPRGLDRRAVAEAAEIKRLQPWKRFFASVRIAASRALTIVRETIAIRRRILVLFNFLDELRPDAMFGHDSGSCGRSDDIMMAYCKSRRIPIAFLPTSPYVGADERIASRFMLLSSGTLPPTVRADYDILNRLFALIRPSWTRTREGHTLFNYDPVYHSAARLAGAGLRDPWQVPTEEFDLLFVFNEYSVKQLTASGIDPAKIVISGQPLLDTVVRNSRDSARQQKLREYFGRPTSAPFALINVDPGIDQGYEDAAQHVRRISRMIEAIKLSGLPIVASLHPACSRARYSFMEELGVFISDEVKIHELYTYCSFAVSFLCSTNRLSELFGKPLIVFNENMAASDRRSRLKDFIFQNTVFCDDYEKLTNAVLQVSKSLSEKRVEVRDYVFACEVIEDHMARVVNLAPPTKDGHAHPHS